MAGACPHIYPEEAGIPNCGRMLMESKWFCSIFSIRSAVTWVADTAVEFMQVRPQSSSRIISNVLATKCRREKNRRDKSCMSDYDN